MEATRQRTTASQTVRPEPEAPPARILCSRPWFAGRTIAGRPIESTLLPDGGLLASLALFTHARRWDAAVFEEDERRLALFCLVKRLVRAKRCRVVSVGANLTPPRSLRGRLRIRVVGWLLRGVDLFLCYVRATERMRNTYRLDPRRFAFVPFKVNTYDIVQSVTPSDEGFALVCGRSDRDYRTLAAAARGLDVPIVVLIGPDHAEHGVDVDRAAMPPNVTLRSDDGSADSWVRWIARARCVVLPVLPDVLKASGISTYLVAMALGKTVIMTECPATQGLIDGGQAVVVPASDPAALREAIARVAADTAFRERTGAAGRAYASALGDERRLADDIVRFVESLIDGEARSLPSAS
jgi:glycosyltransferase involved in cell wall biosynthesis